MKLGGGGGGSGLTGGGGVVVVVNDNISYRSCVAKRISD